MKPFDIHEIISLLKSETAEACSVDDLKQLVGRLGLDFREYPELSRMLFSWMLGGKKADGKNWDVNDYYKFLDQPWLNVNGSGNYMAMVDYLMSNKIQRKEHLELYFKPLDHSLSLGLVSADEISGIIELVPKIKLDTMTVGDNSLLLVQCYRHIWNGLQRCSVLRARDLGPRVLKPWVDILAEAPLSAESFLLATEIGNVIGSFKKSTHSYSLWTSDFLVRRLISSSKKTKRKPVDEYERYSTLAYVESLLGLFTPDVALSYTMLVTGNLLFSPKYNNQLRLELLAFWCWILRRLPNTEHVLSATNWHELWSSSVTTKFSLPIDYDVASISRSNMDFLRLWTLTVLGDKTSHSQRFKFRRVQILDELLSHRELSEPMEAADYIASLIESINALSFRGLPVTDSVLSIIPKPDAEQRPKDHAQLSSKIGETFGKMNPHFGATLKATTNHGRHHSGDVFMFMMFDKLASETDITNPAFIEEALHIIETDYLHRTAFLLLLKHHTPLKIALSKAWGDRQKHAKTPQTTPDVDCRRFPDPFVCLEVLHIFALAFACAKKLSPRYSYSLTHWCYRFVVNHHGPLNPPMVRALYHAGVTRYREANKYIPIPRFEFIMQKVREVEGSQVADALLQEHPYYGDGALGSRPIGLGAL